MDRTTFSWRTLIAAGALSLCMLGFYRASPAAPTRQQPFANPLSQRQEMIDQLKEINRQLREQNTLLRSGRLNVVVVEQKNN